MNKSQISLFIVLSTILILFGVLILSNQNKIGINDDIDSINTKHAKTNIKTCLNDVSKNTIDELLSIGGIFKPEDFENYITVPISFSTSKSLPVYLSYDNFTAKLDIDIIKKQFELMLRETLPVCFCKNYDCSIDDLNSIDDSINTSIKFLDNSIIVDVKYNKMISDNLQNFTISDAVIQIDLDVNVFIKVIDDIKYQSLNKNSIDLSKIDKIAKDNNVYISYDLIYTEENHSYIWYKILNKNNLSFEFLQKINLNDVEEIKIITPYKSFKCYRDEMCDLNIVTNYHMNGQMLDNILFEIENNDFEIFDSDEYGNIHLIANSDQVGVHFISVKVYDKNNPSNYDKALIDIEVLK